MISLSQKKPGSANAWVVTVPVSYRSGGSPGKWKYTESATDFDCFQNGNRIICPDKDMKEYYADSKGYMEIVQLDSERVQADPDKFGMLLGGSGVETHVPEGICIKIK